MKASRINAVLRAAVAQGQVRITTKALEAVLLYLESTYGVENSTITLRGGWVLRLSRNRKGSVLTITVAGFNPAEAVVVEVAVEAKEEVKVNENTLYVEHEAIDSALAFVQKALELAGEGKLADELEFLRETLDQSDKQEWFDSEVENAVWEILEEESTDGVSEVEWLEVEPRVWAEARGRVECRLYTFE